MGEWRTTRSGYTFQIVSAQEVVDALADDELYFTWTCGRPRCGLLVQGGRAGLGAHLRTCHREEPFNL
jgi:hypothetical protein